ncbi:MAG: peptidylprolyl isomerase [Gammaproteobacteria bacterium]
MSVAPEKRSLRIRRLLDVASSTPHRSAVLSAFAVFVGLVLAGLGLFRTAPRHLVKVPPGYVALVNQKGVLVSDWITQTQSDEGVGFDEASPAARKAVLERMIDEELLVQRALALDLPETTIDVRDIMTVAVNNQIAAQVLARTPTEADLRAFYEANLSRYTQRSDMTLVDLVLGVGGYQNADQTTAQALADAAEAVYQLRAGVPLDQVREHFGLVSSGRMEQAAASDLLARRQLGPKLYPVAEALRDGEVSDPVVETDGVHILIMQRHEPARVADFAAARSRVYDDLRTDEAQRATQETLKALRSQAEIVYSPEQPQ